MQVSNGKLPNVFHFDSKAEVEEYARQVGIPATFFLPGCYMSNFPGSMFRQISPADPWTLIMPVPETASIPVFDTVDTGKFVKGIVLHRDSLLGERVYGATTYMTAREVVDGFKSAFPEEGSTAGFFEMPHDNYLYALQGMGIPDFAAQELLENMLLFAEFGYFGGAELDKSHAILEDKLTTWEDHAKKASSFQGLN